MDELHDALGRNILEEVSNSLLGHPGVLALDLEEVAKDIEKDLWCKLNVELKSHPDDYKIAWEQGVTMAISRIRLLIRILQARRKEENEYLSTNELIEENRRIEAANSRRTKKLHRIE